MSERWKEEEKESVSQSVSKSVGMCVCIYVSLSANQTVRNIDVIKYRQITN